MSTMAQNGIGAIPQDIIDCIIDEVASSRRDASDRQDLCNCSLVSPTFRYRSQSWLLRTLNIEIYPADETRPTINAWIHHTLETNPRIASYVRSMTITLPTIDFSECLQPVGTAGFSGSPLLLPNLRELQIMGDNYYNVPFSDLSLELEREFINLIHSPQLHSVLFSGLVPPTNVTELYNLNYLEVRETEYLTMRPSLRGLLRSPCQTDETVRSLLCLCDDWEPEKSLFSRAFAPLELSMKRLKSYAVSLTGPEKLGSVQTVLSGTSQSLCSFSITICEIKNMSALFFDVLPEDKQFLNLKALLNLSELEFIVCRGWFDRSTRIWSFIRNTLLTLPPSNKLTTLKLRFSVRDVSNVLDLAQLDDLLSDVIHFNMLQEVVVLPLGDSKALPKISRRGISVNQCSAHSYLETVDI